MISYIKQQGKHHKKWVKVRKAFLKINPPNHQGYYICTYCRRWIPANEITVDHIVPRSRAPRLRYKFENLAVACSFCNTAKGSKSVKQHTKEVEPLEELY